MNELLADIKAKLQSGDYKNEEHIRLSLVARVLQNLGWDIWNPKEVNTEFIVVPNEDKTRVDVALFLTPFAPAVFIEIKGVGQIQGRLPDIERQLRDYNRNNTALFTIITDGREWRFYYSQTGGEFSKKCFETFDFAEDNLNDIEESLATFLRKSEIENGNAKSKAENYLQKNQKQQTAEDCLPEARRRISEPPYPSLPEALIALVREKGFSVTADEAVKFIKEAAERKPPAPIAYQATQSSTPDSDRRPESPSRRRELNPDNPINLTHTRIVEGHFGVEKISKWVELMDCAMRTAQKSGVPFTFLSGNGNISERNPGHSSFHKIDGTNLWIQGMDSNQAWKRALNLAKKIRADIRVVVFWRDKEGSAYPGEEAVIQWSPLL